MDSDVAVIANASSKSIGHVFRKKDDTPNGTSIGYHGNAAPRACYTNTSTESIRLLRPGDHVSGKVSSEVTKVPLAELRRLLVTESKLSEYIERKDRKKTRKCGER